MTPGAIALIRALKPSLEHISDGALVYEIEDPSYYEGIAKAVAVAQGVNEDALQAVLKRVCAVQHRDWLVQECEKAIRAYVKMLKTPPA